MKFVNDLETGIRIIEEQFPDFKGHDFVGDGSGWDNYAIRVNGKYLFRFPRRQASLEQIKKEAEVLDILNSKLPSYIEVPKYLDARLDCDYPFVYYKMIQGEPLGKKLYDSFTDSKKERFTQQIVVFLHILHSIDTGQCKSLERIDPLKKYQHLYQQVVEICFKYLSAEEQAKTKKLFEDYLRNPAMQDYTPTVVHNDLSENHILITETGIGVIDFGDTDIFDPAIDICWFYLFNKQLFHKIMNKYLGCEDIDFENRISQFYVPIIPYYGVIWGEETHNYDLLEDELNDLRKNLAKV